jgi:hypothetical protein
MQIIHSDFSKKLLIFFVLLNLSSFSALFSQGKNPFFIGIEGAGSSVEVKFPDEGTKRYIAPSGGLLLGKHFGKFRIYTSALFPVRSINERIITKNLGADTDDRIVKYALELSRATLGSDFLFSKYNSSIFLGIGFQGVNAKIVGEFQNLSETEDEIEIIGATAFYRLGYTWTYMEFSIANSAGTIIEEGDFYEPDNIILRNDPDPIPQKITTGEYEIGQFPSFHFALKIVF